ncbi:hypothetical protein, partial [Pseudomonas lactis]|uniref:hypothetical protein n=2 Tax=Pseudomonas TaxID=286 RepID=UPI000AE2F834
WLGRGARTEVPVEVAVNGATTAHDIEKYYVENNLDESVTVFYTLTRADEAMPRYSQITEVLISRGVGELPSPTLLEAQTTGPDTADLEPLKVQQGTQLVVSYVGMRNGDSIKASMVGAGNGGSPDIPAKLGNEALQEVAFDISRAAIAANIRDHVTTVKYHYVVTRAGVSVTSAILTVTVRPIPQSELAKTVIRLNEANSATKVLDLDSFVGNAMAHVGTWPFITAPYPVSLKFFGRTAANVAHDLTLFSFNSSYVNPNWVAQGRYEYRLLRTYLDGLGHGKKLRMEFKAAVSLSKVEAEAISFPIVEYTVVSDSGKFDDLTTFDNYNKNGWAASRGSVDVNLSDGNYYAIGRPYTYLDGSALIGIYKLYRDVQVGRTYRMSFDISLSSPRMRTRVGLNVAGYLILRDYYWSGEGWHTVSLDFVPITQPGDVAIYIFLGFDPEDVKDPVHVDNIRFGPR